MNAILTALNWASALKGTLSIIIVPHNRSLSVHGSPHPYSAGMEHVAAAGGRAGGGGGGGPFYDVLVICRAAINSLSLSSRVGRVDSRDMTKNHKTLKKHLINLYKLKYIWHFIPYDLWDKAGKGAPLVLLLLYCYHCCLRTYSAQIYVVPTRIGYPSVKQ